MERPNAAPRIKAYRSLADLAPLAAQLDALNLASRRPSPFDTFAYLEAFVAHDEYAEPSRRLLLLVAFDGDEPIGFLPLRKERERLWGIPYEAIRFLATHDNDRPRVIARPEDEGRCAEAFYRYLFEVERGWSLLLFNEQDAESKLLTPPASLDLRRCYVRRFPNNPNGTLHLTSRSLREYVRSFSKQHRRSLERGLRRLVAAGRLELVSSTDPRALPGLLELYLDLERRSWKAKVDGHVGRHPQRMAFFRHLIRPDQPMKLLIHLLLLDGVPIGGFIAGAFEGGLYGFEIAFDEAYRDLAPGNAVLLFLIGDGIDEGYRFINFLGNYAYYKSRWHATITETNAVQIFKKGSVLHLKALAGEVRRVIRPPVSQNDVDFNLARTPEPEGEEADAKRPARDAERERARAALAAIEASGAEIRRLSHDAIARTMSLDLKRSAPERTRAAEVTP